LALSQKITGFLEELPYKSPRDVTEGWDWVIKGTRAKSLAVPVLEDVFPVDVTMGS